MWPPQVHWLTAATAVEAVEVAEHTTTALARRGLSLRVGKWILRDIAKRAGMSHPR